MATEETTPPVTEESKEDVKSKDSSVEDAKLAIDMLAQGKRNVICGEIPVAVNQFQEACALLAKQYGETAKECAEAYFCYGQSLLDLARMETGVLGNALQGVDVEEESEEKEETSEQFEKADLKGDERDKLRQEVVEAMSEQEAKGEKADKKGTNGESGMEVENADEKGDKENSEKKGEGESSTLKDKEGEGEEEEEGDEAEEAEEAEGEDDGCEGTSDPKQDEEDADDVSNLQLAWEMLELSKMIYLKDPSKETQLKAAQAYLKLGEVSLETEQYEQATDDFKACLEIQKQHLEAADRLLAETHYQLGLACSFDKKFDMSIEHYKAAIKVIEDKIGILEKVIKENSTGKGKELSSTDDPVSQATQEIKELKEILPDISSKIEDAEEEKKNLEQLKNMTKEIVGETLTTFSSSTESTTAQTIEVKKASDISHLIRRKRKPDDDADGDDQESKKSRQEDGSGDAPVVTQNGHDKKPEEAKKEGEVPAEAEPMAT